jgi:serine/threonine protein kinase
MRPAGRAPRVDGMVRTVAGRYRLLDRIGAGGMGSVWRARDRGTRRELAVKLLDHRDGELLLRFVREQSVRIDHPHVVAPTGWAADDGAVALAMDLVRGGSLEDLLGEHGPLPGEFLAVLLDQALQALDVVHLAGVVHRDVKPANLLLEPTGRGRPHLRLGDFGVAALADEPRLTRHPAPVGTGGYMAPEQAAGAPPDPRQDLYALGVVGIELLTGLPPHGQYGVPDGPLGPLLAALTDRDPARRPSSAAAALGLLRRLEVGEASPGHPRPGSPYVPDRMGPAPADAWLWAALACFAGSLGASGAALGLVVTG